MVGVFAFPEASLACAIICTTMSMDGGSLASKSMAWIFSGNLYPAASRRVKSIVTLLQDGTRCKGWATFVSRSSLNSPKVPEIPGAAYSVLRAEIRPAAVVSVLALQGIRKAKFNGPNDG